MSNLDLLLKNLNLGKKKHGDGASFEEELGETDFNIFHPVSDLGYFSWNPNGGYKSLSQIKSDREIIAHIAEDGKPDRLKAVDQIKTPKRFMTPPSNAFENKFPYGEIDIACIHVATKRGVDLDKVNFCFGGSTLQMLATKDASDPYLASRIPGTKCILVTKKKQYEFDRADLGFQFERYVTGGSMDDTSLTRMVEHLHTMKIGQHSVLFRAEVDAVDNKGCPVEVKASNPRYWGTKVMFQMISNGSSKLCHGEKYRGTLSRVTLKELSSVAATALQYENVKSLEKNIIDGMESLKKQVVDDGVYRVCFECGTLKLGSASARTHALLPSSDVVAALIKK